MGAWVHRLTDIDTQKKTAVCLQCGQIDVKQKGTRKIWVCGNVIRLYKNNHRYKDYVQSYKSKPDRCEVCGVKGKICYDHNHATGEFRGWLCSDCNKALGFVHDNPQILEKLADYIKKPLS